MSAIILVAWGAISIVGWICDALSVEQIYLATSVILAAQYIAARNKENNEDM